MFFKSILVKALQYLVDCIEEEDDADAAAAACTAASRDRFSELPDALLVNILERVGTLDAVSACVFSNHLLKLPAMLSRIVIDVGHVRRGCEDPTNNLDFHDMVRVNSVVAELADKILTTRPPQLTIQKLKFTFILTHDQCVSIGRSVAHAMATHKLDTVEFNILTEVFDCTQADLLRFGKQFNAVFAVSQDAFAGLTTLDIQNLRFGEPDLPNILRTCKRLEYLYMEDCDAGIDSVLQIEHDRLVELKILYGEYQTLVLRRLPKLQRMTCDRWYHDGNPLAFGFVPQLSKLSLINHVISNKTLRLRQLLTNVSSICDLRLDFKREKIWVQPENPRALVPVLGKLRIVNLDNLCEGCDIMWTMFILEVAPSLEELCITVWDHWCVRMHSEKKDVKWRPCDSDFKHENLAKLTIIGFQPDNNFMGYVTHVMEAAVRINEVSLHDKKVCDSASSVLKMVSSFPRRGIHRPARRRIHVFRRLWRGW